MRSVYRVVQKRQNQPSALVIRQDRKLLTVTVIQGDIGLGHLHPPFGHTPDAVYCLGRTRCGMLQIGQQRVQIHE